MRFAPINRGRRFFELFRRQGDIVSETLGELSKSLLEGRSRHARLRDLEHQCDDAAHEIHDLVNNTFSTPLDQDDILRLTSSLDDIVDLAEETADKVDLYRVESVTDAAKEMGEYLAKAGVEIAAATKTLEGSGDLKPHRAEIHKLENEGDRMLRVAIGELFSGEKDPFELVKWKDIYDLLEATMDACEHAANVMESIAIKNS